jgi:hypothetical protein
MKKIIGLGVITGVVVFAYMKALSGKVNRRLLTEGRKEPAQLL